MWLNGAPSAAASPAVKGSRHHRSHRTATLHALVDIERDPYPSWKSDAVSATYLCIEGAAFTPQPAGKALSVLATRELAWPVYVHCTSGRDRTGVVIAAALLAIDVPRQVVAEEYMLSDGADPIAIDRAIDGILEWLPSTELDVTRLRAALASGGGGRAG
ncbi:tyrosine-protein phosphatase [Sorangium sp. So ce1078]|uniref:tyrosine-protein phosphatase n=1 Tax=Sorangium sp. So ce1078 TaxID=3133329 RepID=UPI003F5E8706